MQLRADLEESQAPSLLSQLAATLTARVREPAAAGHVEQLGQLRQQLYASLSKSRTNEFSDAWRLALEELGVWDLLGDRLRDKLESIFVRNEMGVALLE